MRASKLIILLTAFAALFAVISLFGVGISMSFTHNGDMIGCPFVSGTASMCQMGVLEHIAYWQQLFIAKVNDTTILIPWLLFIPLFLAVRQLGTKNKDKTPLDLSFRLYDKSNPQIRLLNYLISAFSKGILHPKIY